MRLIGEASCLYMREGNADDRSHEMADFIVDILSPSSYIGKIFG